MPKSQRQLLPAKHTPNAPPTQRNTLGGRRSNQRASIAALCTANGIVARYPGETLEFKESLFSRGRCGGRAALPGGDEGASDHAEEVAGILDTTRRRMWPRLEIRDVISIGPQRRLPTDAHLAEFLKNQELQHLPPTVQPYS